MKVVADTNTFLAVALNEPDRHRLIESTTGSVLAAPLVLPYEIGNALSAMVRRGRLQTREVMEVWRVTQAIAVELIDIDVGEALKLAGEQGIYAYDAYFLQAAIQLSAPLLTLDQPLQQVARALKLAIVE